MLKFLILITIFCLVSPSFVDEIKKVSKKTSNFVSKAGSQIGSTT